MNKNKLIIVSNRLPVTVEKEDGDFKIKRSVGGLATGISSLNLEMDKIWVGWPGGSDLFESDKRSELSSQLRKKGLYPIFLEEEEIENYYRGFCNEIIWPLFHYFIQYTIYEKTFWEYYKRVNLKFCEEVLKIVDKDDVIWIHDYHLMLLPSMLRAKLPKSRIGFFLHIPFPSSEIFRLIPWCGEIIEGLLGADLIGFHTFDYVRHFGESVRRVKGMEHSLGNMLVEDRTVRIDAFPMGIDFDRFSKAGEEGSVREKVERIKEKIGGDYRVVLSIDRLDYSKGIPQRLKAYNLFLENNPHYREKIIFFLVVVPSRTGVDHYKRLKEEIDNIVGKINGKYGTVGWEPIRYLYRSFDFEDLVSLYVLAEVLFLTPLRDGMNLVAKEYVASKSDCKGVLILGEMAGTAKELGEALIINPNDIEATANALKVALEMPLSEQRHRMEEMRKRLKRYNIQRWAGDYFDRLEQVKKIQLSMMSKELTPRNMKDLAKRVVGAEKVLLLFDYDGTLMPFHPDPQRVKPDEELCFILKCLSDYFATETVIISGRDRHTLDRWVGEVANGIVAEHGVWIKDKEWFMVEPISDAWKAEIRPILELFVDRTPGAFIEEKEFSLVWHYRKVDPALAAVRVGELKDILSHHITSNLNIGVYEGNKVLEIKPSSVNKGRAAQYWLMKKEWDVIIAIGDDWTDEDIFEILPQKAFSIKVGFGPSRAKFSLSTVDKVRMLLKEIIKEIKGVKS